MPSTTEPAPSTATDDRIKQVEASQINSPGPSSTSTRGGEPEKSYGSYHWQGHFWDHLTGLTRQISYVIITLSPPNISSILWSAGNQEKKVLNAQSEALLLRGTCVRHLSNTKTVRSMSNKDNGILAEVINNKGVLTLNRPQVMNAFNEAMVKKMSQKLQEWETKVDCVLVKGADDTVFCAGGDVVEITSGSPSNCERGKNMFRNEYTLNYRTSQYKIPYIALINGLTMGAGFGLSAHGKYRVATEKTVFAVPEVAIGHFPDAGTTHFLPKLEGKLGLYLALTGKRLRGKDVLKIGLGTHYLDSKDVPKLLDAIIKTKDGDVDSVMKKHSIDVSDHIFSLRPHMDLINRAFSAPTVEEIFRRLEQDGSQFGIETLNLLNKMSPISLKIAKLALEKGANKGLKECVEMEYRVASAILEAISSPDIYEGVRAMLIDKDKNPKWKPAKLEDVSEEMVNKLFLPIAPKNELRL